MKRRARAAAGKTVKARSRRSLYLKRPTAPKTIATHGSASKEAEVARRPRITKYSRLRVCAKVAQRPVDFLAIFVAGVADHWPTNMETRIHLYGMVLPILISASLTPGPYCPAAKGCPLARTMLMVKRPMIIVRFTVMINYLCRVHAPSRAKTTRRVPEAALFKFQMLARRWACALLANMTSARPVSSSQPAVSTIPLQAVPCDRRLLSRWTTVGTSAPGLLSFTSRSIRGSFRGILDITVKS
jgi:hypothetical protein